MPVPVPSFQSFRPQQREVGLVSWRVWAPRAREVELVLLEETSSSRYRMEESSPGVFAIERPGESGQRYAYSLDGGPPRPDPCSVHQPEGVHHPSALYFPELHSWRSPNPSRSRSDLILYEMHIGTFTESGTFDAAIACLDDLVDLGINTIEVLPVAQFPGERNWGYDGVHPYATQHSYGGPAAFQRFIDAAHERDLGVILDVVFNHLGPEGNYLGEFGPYFTDRHSTPWGPAFRFDDPGATPVRDWVLDCVWQWIHDFRLDGLRLDAVHTILDESPRHLLTEIKHVADEAARARPGNGSIQIIAESLVNDPRMVTPTTEGGLGLDAEWNEDFHHALSAWMTGEIHGKYIDYGTFDAVENVLRENLHLTGQHSRFYEKPWGKPAHMVPPDRYVISLQNHDHIGNRARGERIAVQVDERHLRLGACLTLLSPFLPMLFMGEEYGETNPFLFFCSFSDPRVIRGVREGRKRDYALSGEIPDPQDENSFLESQLSWEWENDDSRKRLRELYRDLIRLRLAEPRLRRMKTRTLRRIEEDGAIVLCLENDGLRRWFNVSDLPTCLPDTRRILWRSGDSSDRIGAWETVLTTT